MEYKNDYVNWIFPKEIKETVEILFGYNLINNSMPPHKIIEQIEEEKIFDPDLTMDLDQYIRIENSVTMRWSDNVCINSVLVMYCTGHNSNPKKNAYICTPALNMAVYKHPLDNGRCSYTFNATFIRFKEFDDFNNISLLGMCVHLYSNTDKIPSVVTIPYSDGNTQ